MSQATLYLWSLQMSMSLCAQWWEVLECSTMCSIQTTVFSQAAVHNWLKPRLCCSAKLPYLQYPRGKVHIAGQALLQTRHCTSHCWGYFLEHCSCSLGCSCSYILFWIFWRRDRGREEPHGSRREWMSFAYHCYGTRSCYIYITTPFAQFFDIDSWQSSPWFAAEWHSDISS